MAQRQLEPQADPEAVPADSPASRLQAHPSIQSALGEAEGARATPPRGGSIGERGSVVTAAPAGDKASLWAGNPLSVSQFHSSEIFFIAHSRYCKSMYIDSIPSRPASLIPSIGMCPPEKCLYGKVSLRVVAALHSRDGLKLAESANP